jgi:hypothetical protein
MTTRLSGLCRTFLTLPGYAAWAAPLVPVWVMGRPPAERGERP